MIPSVFISSTVDDLRHIRDVVRATVEEVGYQPIMSEYGEIGYMSGDTAEDACYRTVPECQLVVLIIGKHYGSAARKDSDKTITEIEFEKAMEHCSHIITLVDREVLGFKKVFDANTPDKKVSFPGMNDPYKTFEFISRVSRAPSKNAIVPFSNASDVRDILKRQFAILVYDLLIAKSSPAIASINDILSEVKTMRQAMTKKTEPDVKFLAAVRFLLDDENVHLRNVMKNAMAGSVDAAIPRVVENDDFESFLKACGVKYNIQDMESGFDSRRPTKYRRRCAFATRSDVIPEPGMNFLDARYSWSENREIIMNKSAFDYFCNAYQEIKRQMEVAV